MFKLQLRRKFETVLNNRFGEPRHLHKIPPQQSMSKLNTLPINYKV